MKSLAFALVLALPGLAAADTKTFNGGKGAAVDCGKDPEVNINHGKGTYTFKGACKTINVNGGENKLTIESIETLNINGGHNAADIGAVGTISINGASNTITYKKSAKGDKPQVTIVGDGNKVDKAK